jgi:integrase
MLDRTCIHVPKCRLHKPTGLAVVRLSGRDVYLGPYGSPESEARYEAAVAEWLKNDRKPPPRPSRRVPRDHLVVDELILAYLGFAKGYYVKGSKQTGEVRNIKDALRLASSHFGSTLVAEFGPVDLKIVRKAMAEAGLCRNVVNARTNRIRRMFKWGVENQLVEPAVLQGLQAVAPLKKGRSAARETDGVKPVPRACIDEVLRHVTRPVKAMIELQLVSGMRPGEVVLMRTCNIDMSGKTWEYRPESHKTEHHGIERVVFLGPQAQAIVRPFLKHDVQAYLFSPADALQDLHQRRAAAAHVRRSADQLKRKTKPCKQPGEHYTSASYCYAIHKACRTAGVHVWGPNRLRHNAATFLRKEFGLDAARVILGHTSAAVTEVYAEMDRKKAAEIMEQVG